MAKVITDSNFDEIVKSEKPVMLDFWAEWCGPCRAISPIIDELSEEFAEKITIGKVNVDDNTDLSEKFQIRTIPTILVFKGGEVVGKHVGSATKKTLLDLIDSIN